MGMDYFAEKFYAIIIDKNESIQTVECILVTSQHVLERVFTILWIMLFIKKCTS